MYRLTRYSHRMNRTSKLKISITNGYYLGRVLFLLEPWILWIDGFHWIWPFFFLFFQSRDIQWITFFWNLSVQDDPEHLEGFASGFSGSTTFIKKNKKHPPKKKKKIKIEKNFWKIKNSLWIENPLDRTGSGLGFDPEILRSTGCSTGKKRTRP